MKLSSGFYAIAGALITACAVLGGQIYESRQVSIRHARELAYNAALTEWKGRVEAIRSIMDRTGKCMGPPSFEALLLRHMMFSTIVLNHGAENASREKSQEYLDHLIEKHGEKASKPAPGITPDNKGDDNGLPEAKKDELCPS